MLKKIALLCLLNAPLFCQDISKNPANPDQFAIKEELKSLHAAQKQTTLAISSLIKKLPLFPRTKIFFAGALAGSVTVLYLGHKYPEAFQCPRTKILRILDALESSQPHEIKAADNNTAIQNEDDFEKAEAAEEAARA